MKFSQEHKNKIRKALLGNKNCFGRKYSEYTLKKMRESAKREGTGKWNKGTIWTKERIAKISKTKTGKPQPWNTGKKHHNWKGGLTPIIQKERGSIRYRKWVKDIFKRDNYTCVLCGQYGGQLNVHHIKSFTHYPNLRYVFSNGKTLCKKCHSETDNYKGKNKIKVK